MRRRLVSGVVVLFAVLALAATALARPGFAGDQINILAGNPTTYAADAPFHVLHGWGMKDPAEKGAYVAGYGFQLEVDGLWMGRGHVIVQRNNETKSLTRRYLYEFPDGLSAGDHTFVGHWYMPCQEAVDTGQWTGECAHKNTPVEVLTWIHVVTFS